MAYHNRRTGDITLKSTKIYSHTIRSLKFGLAKLYVAIKLSTKHSNVVKERMIKLRIVLMKETQLEQTIRRS